MFGRKQSVQVRVWADAPKLAIPENPAVFCYAEDLWLAYETAAETLGKIYAVIRFQDVIDHRLSPINDEGLGQHKYASAGLKFYAFNEILNAPETEKWAATKTRYWVITFKDVTLDVIARSAIVVHSSVHAIGPVTALLPVVVANASAET